VELVVEQVIVEDWPVAMVAGATGRFTVGWEGGAGGGAGGGAAGGGARGGCLWQPTVSKSPPNIVRPKKTLRLCAYIFLLIMYDADVMECRREMPEAYRTGRPR